MSGETQRQDDASEGDGRAWTPPPPHETPETLRVLPIMASLRPRQQVLRPIWLLFAAAGVALTAWILTPEDPYAAALAS